MIKIEKNKEINNLIDKIIKNIMENMDSDNPATLKYRSERLTPNIEKELNDLYKNEFNLDMMVKEPISKILDIQYNKDIKFEGIVPNEYLKIEYIPKLELHTRDFAIYDKYLKACVPLVAYPKSIKIPCIKENDDVWMSPTLMEYNTIIEPLNRAKGNVLTFGLGCGFFPYMCLIKDEVESVTIVEINKDIINTFKEYILPQFPKDKKIKIIEGDAFDYFNDKFVNNFDYTFVDIWKSNSDGINIHERLIKQKKILDNIDFWIEDNLLYDVQISIITYLLNLKNGTLTEILNKPSSDFFVKYFKAIHRVFRGMDNVLRTEEDIMDLIHNKEFLYKVIRNL